MFQPFVCPPSNKHWWILSALSVYGSTMLSVNSRLVHLLAVLIPLTNLVPPFCFACSVFVMLKWHSFAVKWYVFICIRGETDVWTKSNVRIRHRFSHVPSQAMWNERSRQWLHTCSFFKSVRFLFLSLFVSISLHGCLKAAYITVHAPTHTHLGYYTTEKYVLVSAVNRAPRIHPLMCTTLNKAELLALFHTTPVWEHIYIHTYTLACRVDKVIQALYIARFLMSSLTHTHTHLRGFGSVGKTQSQPYH